MADILIPNPDSVTLAGRVVSVVDGAGIPGVTVTVGGRLCVADAKGDFVLKERVPAGRREVIVSDAVAKGVGFRGLGRVLDVKRRRKPIRVVVMPMGPGIVVKTEPSGASIRLDGELLPQVRTPGFVPTIPGSHFVEASMPGSSRWGTATQIGLVPDSGVTVISLPLPAIAGSRR